MNCELPVHPTFGVTPERRAEGPTSAQPRATSWE